VKEGQEVGEMKSVWQSVKKKKMWNQARRQWLRPVILAIWEAEIWRLRFQGILQQVVHKTPPSPK
jgi:hypothetical protein